MKKRNKRIFWVVVLLVLVSVSTLSVLGYKKSNNNKDKDENNVVKDNVKIITEESDKQPILVESKIQKRRCHCFRNYKFSTKWFYTKCYWSTENKRKIHYTNRTCCIDGCI